MRHRFVACLLAACVSITAFSSVDQPLYDWSQLLPLPDPQGFASPLAGVVDGALVIAGGANFSAAPLWRNGAKTWHDRIFVLEPGAENWQLAGRLPGPLAYAVSVTTDDGLLCIGGGDAKAHSSKVFLLARKNGAIEFEALSSLPRPVAMAAGARAGNFVYVAGGLESPSASETLTTFYALDLRQPAKGWRELPSWPGPGRSQAVAGAIGEDFYLFSGLRHDADANGRRILVYLKDAYRYSPSRGWEKLPDLPYAAAAAASPAPADGQDLLLIGGVDGSGVGKVPLDFYHAAQRIQRYSPSQNSWSEAGNAPVGRACIAATEWRGRWILPSGERSGGVRSPEIWTLGTSPPRP